MCPKSASRWSGLVEGGRGFWLRFGWSMRAPPLKYELRGPEPVKSGFVCVVGGRCSIEYAVHGGDIRRIPRRDLAD